LGTWKSIESHDQRTLTTNSLKVACKLWSHMGMLRGKRAFLKLADTITKDDLKATVESSREFREKFTFRLICLTQLWF